MPIVGSGRIVVWEGAGLWLLASEETADLPAHAHHAVQITFCLKGWFEIGLAGETLAGPVAAVASDVPHSFRASGAVAFVFVAPESAAGRALKQQWFAERPGVEVHEGPLLVLLDALRGCFERGGSEADAVALGRRIVDALPTAEPRAMPDPRVLAMIGHARENLENVLTLPGAAARAGLSPSRARHLFVAQTGLPFKTYVLWLRIERAVALYAAGASLTAAAHEAGFADSAHFSRTFRRTFGLPAAGLRLERS